jgi:phosphatidylglycerophosphate synthase
MSTATHTRPGFVRPPAPKVSVYAASDDGFMAKSQRLRQVLLDPALRALARAGVKANHVTGLSLMLGLIGAGVLSTQPALALVLIGLHVLLDGLDGPIARARGEAGSSGALTDTLADQLVVSAVGIAAIDAGHAGLFDGAAYLLTYNTVVGLALARSALAVPYRWLVRPRFVIYAWLAVELFLLPGTLPLLHWGFAALLAIKVFTGFVQLRHALKVRERGGDRAAARN